MSATMKRLDLRECKRMFDKDGEEKASRRIREWAETHKIRIGTMSLREMFEELVDDGESRIERLRPRKRSTAIPLSEAIDATSTSAFVNIFGILVETEVKEAYESPELLWPKLFDSRQTNKLRYDRIRGVGKLPDKGTEVGEGEEYTRIGVSEEYFDRGALKKNGFTTGITREATIEDDMGVVTDQLSAGIDIMKISGEKRALDIACGITNTYNRTGVGTNTYLSSGAYVNAYSSNALIDWRSLDTVIKGQAALTDPNTGEPISLGENSGIDTIWVPPALKGPAHLVTTQQSVERVDNQAAAGTYRVMSGVPYQGVVKNVLCSQYVKLRTSSDTKWFGGQPKKAFRRYYAWDIESEMRTDSDAKFYRDIIMEWKFGVMDLFHSYEPRYVFSSDA